MPAYELWIHRVLLKIGGYSTDKESSFKSRIYCVFTIAPSNAMNDINPSFVIKLTILKLLASDWIVRYSVQCYVGAILK